MVHIWWGNETFSHGLLILPISIWLIWRNKQVFESTPIEPSWLGLFAFCGGAFGWLLGALADVRMVQHLGIVTMLVAAVPMVFGLAIANRLMFPILFLFFMVPSGEFLVPVLMKYTADATIAALQFSGIPVFRENMHFTLPTGRWSVVEACSGLRYVIAAMVLAFMFAYLNYRSWIKKLTFVLVCLVIAVVSNWARAYIVVLVGHFSNMKYGTGDDHIYYGWFFFGIVMFAIFWFGMRWRDHDMGGNEIGVTNDSNGNLAEHSASGTLLGFRAKPLIIVLAIASMVMAQQAPSFLLNAKPRNDIQREFKASNPDFIDTDKLAIAPTFVAATANVRAALLDSTEAFVAYYAKQTDDAEMITGANSFVSSSDTKWTIMAASNQEHGQFGGFSGVSEMTLKTSGDVQRLAWMWYCVGGYCVREAWLAKGFTAWGALRGKGDHSVAVMLSTPIVNGNVDGARKLLQNRKVGLDLFATKFTALN